MEGKNALRNCLPKLTHEIYFGRVAARGNVKRRGTCALVMITGDKIRYVRADVGYVGHEDGKSIKSEISKASSWFIFSLLVTRDLF